MPVITASVVGKTPRRLGRERGVEVMGSRRRCTRGLGLSRLGSRGINGSGEGFQLLRWPFEAEGNLAVGRHSTRA